MNNVKLQTKVTDVFELNLLANQKLIPKKLLDFLLSAEYPWELLGKNLSEFVTEWISEFAESEQFKGDISSQALIQDKSTLVICAGASVEAGAFIAGPTILLPGAKVKHGAYVRGSVIACQDSIIGHTTEVKGSILLPGAKASHFAYVGDSILGFNCNLGAGTKLANLRFDHEEIKVRLGHGNSIKSGQKKLGAVFGNRAQSGCNSVTNPGTILLPDAMLAPCALGKGIISR